jgi:NAD(P)-dependent dehydrogenase (short-subunit alcohol dehydrogenase family)
MKLVAVVTGGSNGIGEGICAHLLEAGATTINIDIVAPKKSPAGDYHFFQCDLTDATATRKLAADLAARFEVNCLVNNAGFPTPGTLEEITDQAFDHGANLHLRCAIILMQAFVPGMKARRFGRVVNMSSRSILGKKARTVYAGTKAALVAYTRSWALELGEHGITVNAISPGPVITELFTKYQKPDVIEKLVGLTVVGRAGNPGDVARAAMFFLSPDNSYVTGQTLHVCGGSSLGGAPW